MGQAESRVRVFVAQGEVLPGAFRWNGRTLRVLTAEPAGIRGNERRYRLSTREGAYELGVEIGTGAWHVRRSPGWISRLWAGVQAAPRYPLPGWRRRHLRPAAAPRLTPAEPRRLTAEPKRTSA
jgi:hypothetical protein